MRKRLERMVVVASTLVFASVAFADIVKPEFGGALALPEAEVRFSPFLFTSGWEGASGFDVVSSSCAGGREFAIRVPKAGTREVRGRVTFAPSEKAVSARWSFVPSDRSDLAFLGLMSQLRLSRHGNASFEADGRQIAVPASYSGNPQLFAGDVRELKMMTAGGTTVFGLVFPRKTHVLVQDDRAWNSMAVSLRLSVAEGDLALTLSTGGSLSWAPSDPVRLAPGKDWIPLEPELDVEPGSALDFSNLCGAREPAGRYGRVVVRNGHFEFANRVGRPCRFYGVNIVDTANTPDPEVGRRFAVRLARMGYNALRIHHHDDVLALRDGDRTELDDEAMCRFDALVAACIENGIYLTTDLFVSRRVPWRAVGIDREGEIGLSEFKVLMQFHEGACLNMLRFVRNFLDHVNPRTGRRYADEPALAWLSFVNEGPLTALGEQLPLKDIPGVEEKWRSWLKRKRSEVSAWKDLTDDLPDVRRVDAARPRSARETAVLQFLADAEREFSRRVTRFLREKMKCCALTTNMNCGWHTSALQVLRATEYDYVDDHFYVDHPEFLGADWRMPSRCSNVNPLNGPDRGVPQDVICRVFGKPFTITEYNYSAPGRFRGLGGMAAAALASLQDWDGLWRFAWTHGEPGLRMVKPMNYFDLCGDPLACASERAAVCLFLREDVCRLERKCALVLPASKVLACTEALPDHSLPGLSPIAWLWQVGCSMSASAPENVRLVGAFPDVYTKSSAELKQNLKDVKAGPTAVVVDSERGSLVLNTPRTAGGFAEGGELVAGALVAHLSGGPATIWVSSIDGKPIAESLRLLVVHLTDVQNTDVTYADESKRVLLAWGKLPHLMRCGRSEVSVGVRAGVWKVYALGTSGRRRGEVPCRLSEGRLSFVADVARDRENATLFYELVRQELETQ